MLVGLHFLEDSYAGPTLPCAAFLDVAGTGVGMKSAERLVRIYFKGNPDPAAIAQKARSWHTQGCRVQIGNEPNLTDVEQWKGGPDTFATFFARVAELAPGVRLYWPGISPGVPGYEEWYVGRCADVIRQHAAGIVVHAYGTAKECLGPLGMAVSAGLGKPLWVAECNPGAGQSFDRDAWARDELPKILDYCRAARCEAWTYFAYRWPTPDMSLPTPVDAAGTAIERAILDYKEPITVATTLRAIDISNNNGHVDLKRVRDEGKYEAVIVKISEDDWGDDDFFDSYAALNLANARELEMGVGVYTFLRPSLSSPAESITLIERALAKLGGLRAGEVVALDVEDPDFTGDLHVWLAEALALGSQVFGFPIWKYSADWYTSTRNLEHADLAPYPTWWASYQTNLPDPQVGWDPIRMWQNGVLPAGSVPGVAGDCDVNVFYGTLADFKDLGKPAGPSPVIVTPSPEPDLIGGALADARAALDRLERLIKEKAA